MLKGPSGEIKFALVHIYVTDVGKLVFLIRDICGSVRRLFSLEELPERALGIAKLIVGPSHIALSHEFHNSGVQTFSQVIRLPRLIDCFVKVALRQCLITEIQQRCALEKMVALGTGKGEALAIELLSGV